VVGLVVAGALVLVRCSTNAPPAPPAAEQAAARDAAPPPAEAAPGQDLSPLPDLLSPDSVPACSAGASSCPDLDHQRQCKEVGGRLEWVTEACGPGSRCLATACASSCTDECLLGASREVAGKTQECKLYSLAAGKSVAPGAGTRDRARLHDAWLRAHHLPAGVVFNAWFTDQTLSKLGGYGHTRDGAIWTGSYLAAEALRLQVTGSPEARANAEHLVEILHGLFAITGDPGYMARQAAPLGVDPLLDALYDPTNPEHHKVKVQGKDWFYTGSTSRDQYQGVVLGYALAYEALSSTTHRQLIRDDLVTFCSELIKDRKQVPVNLRFKVGGTWIELPLKYDVQYALLVPSEFKNGAPYLQIGSDEDPTALDESTQSGFREFMPDPSVMLKQTPFIGALIPPLPRSGSAIMLSSFLRACIKVTDGVPGYTQANQTFVDHYQKNIASFTDVAKSWGYTYAGPPGCWKAYYGLNISHQPMYNLLRLENDPALLATFRQGFAGKMWQFIKDHKNPYFTFMHAALQNGPTAAQVTDAVAQLAQFGPPPIVHLAVDLTGKYPADPGCPGKTTVAVDVKDRLHEDFMWQSDPFTLVGEGALTTVHPGVDYLIAYWLGRHHGFITDDAPGTCLRWE